MTYMYRAGAKTMPHKCVVVLMEGWSLTHVSACLSFVMNLVKAISLSHCERYGIYPTVAVKC